MPRPQGPKKNPKTDNPRNSGGNNYSNGSRRNNRPWKKWGKDSGNFNKYTKHYSSKYHNSRQRGNWEYNGNNGYDNPQSFYVDTVGDQSHEMNSSGGSNAPQHTYFNVSTLFNPSEQFSPNWNSGEHFRHSGDDSARSTTRSPLSRANKTSSPLLGTEEYNQLKIQEVSEQIKLKLLDNSNEDSGRISESASETPSSKRDSSSKESHKSKKGKSESKKSSTKTQKKLQYNVEEIHSKIMNHLSNMSHGRKVNLINSSSSGLYDVAIQKIHKQKRLELSKALRNMCTDQSVANVDVINSIIPDLDIKIECLPLEVIKELSNTLDLDLSLQNEDPPPALVSVKQESSVFDDYFLEQDDHKLDLSNVKSEHIDAPESLLNDDDDDDDDIEIIEMSSSEDEIEEIFEVKKEPVKNDDFCKSDENFTEVDTVRNTETCNCITSGIHLDVTITKMFEIDREIDRLTKLRQNLFTDLLASQSGCQNDGNQRSASRILNRSIENEGTSLGDLETSLGKILVIKYIEGELLAASENGQLYIIDLSSMTTLTTIDVSTTPITSLAYKTHKSTPTRLFVGCLETNLKEYNLATRQSERATPLPGSVQCLEISAWNTLFIGCANGYLVRFSLQKNKVEMEDCISDNNAILVLKATKEGARRVLIVGTRNLPVTVRDASTFLHMRTMEGLTSPTVYSLLLENSLVYCGTTAQDILIYSFHAGHLIRKHHATDSKGVSCLKMVENLLFASCYNGKIYVYDTKPHQMIGVVDGPGGVILSMEIVDNWIIVGTMSKIFKIIQIPEDFLGQLNGQNKKRKRKDDAEPSEESKRQKSNTISPSKEYRTLVPAYLALTLLQSEEVVDFSFFCDGSASKCFAFNAKLKSGAEIRKIVLVKYQSNEGKKLQIRCFELDSGKYTFSEGYHNYLKFQPDRENYDFVMYTNCLFGLSARKKSSAFGSTDDVSPWLNTSVDKKKSVVQFQNSDIWDKYGDFLERFYVYHSQKNGDCMKEEIFERLTGFGCAETSVKFFLNSFEKVRKGSTSELRKNDLVTILSNSVLSPSALWLKSSPQIDILNVIFSKFDFTILDGLDFEFLKQFSVKPAECEDNLRVRRPLVVNIDEETSPRVKFLLKLARNSGEPLMLVLTGCCDLVVRDLGDDFRIFKKISDLKESDKDLYCKILDNFCMTLQGEKAVEKVRLKQLFNISESMVDVFSATDLTKMIGDN